jgi:hypothetical protein
MVFPVFENKFKIGTAGLESTDEQMKSIIDMENFSVSFDNGVEEWNPMDQGGWVRRLTTAKGFSISISGKRNTGDEGNDYVAGLAWKTGSEASTKFEWTMIDGTVVTFNCVVNVSSVGGDSTAVDGLEFEVMSDGKPTVTPKSAE